VDRIKFEHLEVEGVWLLMDGIYTSCIMFTNFCLISFFHSLVHQTPNQLTKAKAKRHQAPVASPDDLLHL
jgi:hypothetical protein